MTTLLPVILHLPRNLIKLSHFVFHNTFLLAIIFPKLDVSTISIITDISVSRIVRIKV